MIYDGKPTNKISQIAYNIMEKYSEGEPLEVGNYYLLIPIKNSNETLKVVKIISGRYWGTYGISNCWSWKYLINGKLHKNKYSGYDNGTEGDFKPISRKKAVEISKQLYK